MGYNYRVRFTGAQKSLTEFFNKMCGILGVYTINAAPRFSVVDVTDSLKFLSHRGPDATGVWSDPGTVILGHARLSIIDLSAANNQPFHSSDGRYVISFNGEIYNYIEIRRELQSLGYTFSTTGDTEVLLNSYIEWGSAACKKFNGDWAFGIYDRKDKALFLSRDRFGVKPLRYGRIGQEIIFASEAKAIISLAPSLGYPNTNVIANYCLTGLGAQHTETWFGGVYNLAPAHNMYIDASGCTISKYWEYPREASHSISFSDAIEKYKYLFLDSVHLRMRSDVPVGTTLSSGIDSTSIVAALRESYRGPHHSFTATFDDDEFTGGDRTAYSSGVSISEERVVREFAGQFDLDAEFYNIPADDFVPSLWDSQYYIESGHSSPAIVPLWRLLSVARRKVTVILEGQGADELLAGYIVNYSPAFWMRLLRSGRISAAICEINRFRDTYSLSYALKLLVRQRHSPLLNFVYQQSQGINNVLGDRLLDGYCPISFDSAGFANFNDSLNRELAVAHSWGLVNLLHYGDALSMGNSMESRLPFMDHRLVECSFQLPSEFKIHDGLGKYIHRHAMKNLLPASIAQNPVKFGFNTPLSSQFRTTESIGNRILLSDRCLERGVFSADRLRGVIEAQVSEKRENSNFLYKCLSIELWFRRFQDSSCREWTKANY